ncbi:M23 family metallopeptidase [Pseudoalteromonas piratica]|uniref:M23 family metallopeptidase n=1 Tax=Pseudoalteromonas piratica TaxID=1348114 RepID=UPI000AED3F91|nr:M23 family metallopeptidase [Pseudoalteromonas piratica]
MPYIFIFLMLLVLSACKDETKKVHLPKKQLQEEVTENKSQQSRKTNTQTKFAVSDEKQFTYSLNQGETLTHVLASAGFNMANIVSLAKAVKPHYDFKKIRPGTQFDAIETENKKVLRFAIDYAKLIEATLLNETWQIEVVKATLITHEMSRSFAINHSLYHAANQEKIPHNIINSAVLAMSHFIDFQREIRQGDAITLNFTVSEVTHNAHLYNQFSAPQTLVAINFKNQTKQYSLYQFQNAFYFKDGKLAQNFLMKTPLNGARLSSYFGKRKHPVLGYTRQHKGIDFSAPIGTPIMAAGKGKVLKASYSRSFGNRVLIDHGNGYRTLYAHLKGFAKGIKQGSRVSQGQTIGYLGNTGLSTARHLHYEVHKNGRAVNPLNMKQPSNVQLEGEQLIAFKAHTNQIDNHYASLVYDNKMPTTLD